MHCNGGRGPLSSSRGLSDRQGSHKEFSESTGAFVVRVSVLELPCVVIMDTGVVSLAGSTLKEGDGPDRLWW